MLNIKKANAKRDIHDRLHKFSLDILNVVQLIPKSIENMILIKQMIRSATSIGANALEADGSETKKEFIHRFAIAKKEAKESHYWLTLISEHNTKIKSKLTTLIDENKQLILIISRIILNAKKGII